MPNSTSLSFEDAVRYFKEWGLKVEPGPRPEEVTLIIEAPDCRTYCVYPAAMLPEIASAALSVRRRNRALSAAWNLSLTQELYTTPVAVEPGLVLN